MLFLLALCRHFKLAIYLFREIIIQTAKDFLSNAANSQIYFFSYTEKILVAN